MNIKKVKKLLGQYTHIVEELKNMGVIRTGKVVADYGEYIVSKKLKLKLVDNPTNKGYDAIDKNGRRYEIKARKATSWNKPSLFPARKNQLSKVDFLVYIEFGNNWDLVRLLKIPAKKVRPSKSNRVYVSPDLIKKFSVL